MSSLEPVSGESASPVPEGGAQVLADAAVKPSVGERLRAARESQGLDVGGVSAALKLSPRQVNALEGGDWQSLPGQVFIRGFIRNYARLVQLDPDALLADLPAMSTPKPRLDVPTESTVAIPQRGSAQRRDSLLLTGSALLLLLGLAVYFLVPKGFWNPVEFSVNPGDVADSGASEVSEAVQAQSVSPTLSEQGETPAGDALPVVAASVSENRTDSSSASSPDVSSLGVSPDASARVPTERADKTGEGSARVLHLSFAQPSWVQIRDRSGQIVLEQISTAGSEKTVEGQPPFSLVVGNSPHVTVRYQGRIVDLNPRSRDGVARVTVE